MVEYRVDGLLGGDPDIGDSTPRDRDTLFADPVLAGTFATAIDVDGDTAILEFLCGIVAAFPILGRVGNENKS